MSAAQKPDLMFTSVRASNLTITINNESSKQQSQQSLGLYFLMPGGDCDGMTKIVKLWFKLLQLYVDTPSNITKDDLRGARSKFIGFRCSNARDFVASLSTYNGATRITLLAFADVRPRVRWATRASARYWRATSLYLFGLWYP